MYGVTITELIKKMKMKNVLPEIDTDKVVLSHPAMWSRLISILFRGRCG